VSERNITEDEIRNEHLDEVNVVAHWAYLAAVIDGAALLMVGLIAYLGTTVPR
jgi:hypothetical protein